MMLGQTKITCYLCNRVFWIVDDGKAVWCPFCREQVMKSASVSLSGNIRNSHTRRRSTISKIVVITEELSRILDSMKVITEEIS